MLLLKLLKIPPIDNLPCKYWASVKEAAQSELDALSYSRLEALHALNRDSHPFFQRHDLSCGEERKATYLLITQACFFLIS